MESEFMHGHKHWLSIAQEDLASAKLLSNEPFMTALFHIQQCAEKALKAYIVLKKNSFIKTHDLGKLVDISMEIDEDFETLRLLAAVLTPYETAGRYPSSDFIRLSIKEIEILIAQSEFVFNFVMQRINKV